jgi:hypothetical protein
MTRVAVILFLFVAGFAAAARAQYGAPADTSRKTAPADTVPHTSLTPSYTGSIRGNVNSVTLGNRFSTALLMANGLRGVFNLSTEQTDYRLQDRRDTNNTLTANIIQFNATGLSYDASISDLRYFNRVVTVTNATQDLFNNSQKVGANAFYTRLLQRGFAFNTKTSLGAGRSEQTFLNDNTQDGALGVGIRYFRGGQFNATARGYFHLISQDAESGGRNFSGLGTAEDSVLARASLVVRDSSTVRAEYSRFTSKEDYLELPRDSFGAQQFDASKIAPEQQSRDVRNVVIDARFKPLRAWGVVVTAKAEHTDGATYFAEAKQRTSRDTGNSFAGAVEYVTGPANRIKFDVDTRRGTHWLGPERAGSYDDEDTNLRFTWIQTLTGTLSASAQAGASLNQSFYVDTDRDRDQRFQFANLRFTSKIIPKVSASAYLSVGKTDYVNIKSSQSQDNRAETIYELRPEYTYAITPRISLTQKYWMNIQYADFVFQENENYLDRNFTFSNQLNVKLTTNISADFYYGIRFYNKGSYLRPNPDAERVLEIYQEERRDEFKLKFRYAIDKHIALTGLNEYNRREDTLTPSGAVFEDGGLEIGIDGQYDLGSDGVLKFAMRRVKRFGAFNVDAQKDYWVMDSTLNYTF